MGHTCSQFFVRTDTDRWYAQPLKKESHNSTALQDFSRNVGLPLFVKSNCAQSEIGEKWTEHCRDHCIRMLTSEPGHPWKNPAKKRIGTLGNMVIANMRETGMPMQYHNWMQLWCVVLSAGQLCNLQMRPEHVASRTAIYGFSTISDDATALR